jgi:hypothetical protein
MGTAASPSSGAHGAGRLLLGVLGDPDRFDQQTTQRSRFRLLIVSWGQGGTPQYFASLFATMREVPMLGVSTGGGEGGGAEMITAGQVARGAGDSFLVALNQAIAAWGKPIYVRPLAEMNGHWNAYCAFNRDGSARSADHSTVAFRKAFARLYLLVHGAPNVNQRLRKLGLPPVSGRLASNPLVRVIWNPQGYGSPDLPGNSAESYYPGDAYVDVVGDDLYDIRGKAEWAAAEALYRAHPGKRFAFPEWALWGIDDPGFVTKMADFVRSHGRTELIGYYSGQPGSIFDLAAKARSLASYRQVIAPLGHWSRPVSRPSTASGTVEPWGTSRMRSFSPPMRWRRWSESPCSCTPTATAADIRRPGGSRSFSFSASLCRST